MVLTVSSALSLVTGLVCHHRRRNFFRQLDASVGASGPNGFTVRKPSAFVNALLTSTASRPASVTIASRPSGGTRRHDYGSDLPKKRTGLFLRRGLDDPPNQQMEQLPECAHETNCAVIFRSVLSGGFGKRERLRPRIAAALLSPNGHTGIRR